MATRTTPQETKICAWLADHRQAMIDLIEEVVNIDSGSYDKAGVDAVGDRFIRHYTERGMARPASSRTRPSATPSTSASTTARRTRSRSC